MPDNLKYIHFTVTFVKSLKKIVYNLSITKMHFLSFRFWSDQSFDNGDPNSSQACVVMNHTKPLLTNWEIAPCEFKHRWLCEKSPN